MNMIELSVTIDTGHQGPYPTFKLEVDLITVAQRLEPFLTEKQSQGYTVGEDVWNRFLIDLIPGAKEIARQYDFRVARSSPEPPLFWEAPDSWITMSFEGTAHWVFFHQYAHSDYVRVPVPDMCKVEPTGDIVVELPGHATVMVRRPLDGKPDPRSSWPWVLLQPQAWVAVWDLTMLLVPDQTEPLTILVRSGFPAKGLALQLKEKLTESLKLLRAGLKET